MLTTCPECRTTFKLSPAQLDARRGLVRCGYCRAVFNAYDTLLPDAAPEVAAPDRDAGPAIDTIAPDWDIPPPILPEALRRNPGRELPGAEPEGDSEGEAEDAGEPAYVLHLGEEQGAAPEAEARGESADDILLSDLPIRDRERPARRGGALSSILGGVLFLLLLGQLAFFLRGPLVAWLPELRPQVQSACQALGCRIPLASEPDAIRIEASSLETDPEQPNRATLRVSFSNRSKLAQQWPYMVLKLTDWQGSPLAQRAFRPANYLGKDEDLGAGIAPLSEREFRLDLDLAGLNASGYEVVARYR